MVTKETLKPWFSNGKKPDEQQFWAWMESYWHKEEKIPIEVIEDINNILVNKADKELVDKLTQELSNKVDNEIVQALQAYVYGLIDDTLYTASDKTYSIDKIREITEEFLTEAVTDVSYDEETGTLIIEYKEDESKEINLPKDNFLSEVKYNPETKEIKFTMSGGSIFTVNLSDSFTTYEASEKGGLEIVNTNQFQIKEKGVVSTMLSEELQEKLSKTGGTLQEITTNGNSTDKDIITNEAIIGRDITNENLKFGKDALKSVTTAKYNTAIGDNALVDNQTSPENTAIGYNALNKLNGKGDYNTALGAYAGEAIIESMNCTFIGTAAGHVAPNANRDTFIGATSGYKYTGQPKDNGLPVGKMDSGSNTFVGDSAGYSMTRGFGNTFVGNRSGVYFTYGGAYNTFIGYGITNFTSHTYGTNNVIIGANAPCYGYIANKLIIHSQGDGKNGGSYATEALIKGDFAERWFKLSGKYILNYTYTPDADSTPVEGQQAFTPTKMLVADAGGNVGIKKIPTPETPISSTFLHTKNYYSTIFAHAFTETSETDYIKIQDAIPGNVSNLFIRGRLLVAGAYQKFELIGSLNNTGFNSCFLETSKSEDLINSIGLVYYDKGQVMLWIKGNVNHQNTYTNIIIDQIQAFEGSTDLNWNDNALVEFKANTLNESLITASITAQLI
ncbi:hypothetical protein [Apibacter adventoris]|uniref:hypothetical protein n=1 Tax=Apibacter adventoris TaxID=1679466 RepID=UPI001FE28090|nr:hypothetical protein [Apibacter adventoris]